jgi:hypothetical protein
VGPGAPLERGRQVHAELPDSFRHAAVRHQIHPEGAEHVGVLPLGSEQQLRPLQIHEEAHVLVAPLARRLVDAHMPHVRVVRFRPRLAHVVLQHPPQQLESGTPAPEVVRLLGDALLALAHAHHLPHDTQANLAHRVSALNSRVRAIAPAGR